MKLLLDENIDVRLKHDLVGHVAECVTEIGWAGKSNGELLQLMITSGFDVLITADQNLQYQQNFQKYPVSVIMVTGGTTLDQFRRVVPQVLELLKQPLQPGVTKVG